MRMIPSEITLGTPSDAEKKVFEMLRGIDLGGGETCMHSLGLSRHLYQQLGEVDFVIVGARGILLLEVKGGRVSRDRGRWVFRNRWGDERRENRGPIKQVEGNMWSLIDRVNDHLGSDLRRRHVIGFGAIFTDVEWNVTSTEWEPEWIADRGVIERRGGLRGFLLDLYRHWDEAKKSSSEPMSGQLQTRIIRLLRPDFDLVPTLGQLGESIDSRLTSLTEQQYEKLDFVESVPRALVCGGGGTGKTMLAVHVARREASLGWRVLLVCHSAVLARYLDAQLEGSGTEVRTIAGPEPAAPADILVVDEGQDLLNMEALARLDGWLVGGIVGGRWRIFFDHNNQAGIAGRFDPETLELLEGQSFPPLQLHDNCRNTRNIVDFVRAVTGADTGVSTAGAGPDVRVVACATKAEAGHQLATYLDDLVDDGVDPATVAVLSPSGVEDRVVDHLPPRWKRRLVEIDSDSILQHAPGKVIVSSIENFKGLERRFVVVTDIERVPRDPLEVSQLYVAVTRPRAGLTVIVSDQGHDSFSELLEAIQLVREEADLGSA